MKIHTTGIFWYKKDQYDEFRKLLDDGAQLPDTYAEWLNLAENGFNGLAAKGHRVIKVEADIDEFKAWCVRNGYKVNGEGRKGFVNHKLGLSLGLVKE